MSLSPKIVIIFWCNILTFTFEVFFSEFWKTWLLWIIKKRST